ncbi:endonuclease/exonuclease/phosphatase family protein [Demequina sp.]|uniref:endonuclease/exonuclease/phosphatase family protein n=1 Tax=Demequina sp. TaxID=2050685 RepID=UPI003D0F591C
MSDDVWHTFAMRRVLWWLTVVMLAPIAVAVIARAFRLQAGPLAIVVAFMPWVTFACVVPFLLALLARSLTLAAITAGFAALCAWWIMPLYTFEGGGTPALKVASINATFGEADAGDIVAMVKAREIDVLAVQELTEDQVQALRDAGLDSELPSSYVRPEDGFKGIGLWSRYPMDGSPLDGMVANAIQAKVETPSETMTVYAVHPAAPGVTEHKAWADDLSRLTFVLSAAIGPTMVIGDFNTTRDHAQFRTIEGLDYADAADQAGAGFQPTFPEGRTPFPLVAIDHVMVRDTDLRAREFKTVTIDGADHRAIVVEYGERTN